MYICYNKRVHSIPIKYRCFFNLTTADLSRFTNLFTLGLKHIPPPTDISDQELKDAMFSFKSKTLWKYHFERTNLGQFDNESDSNEFVHKLKPPNTTPRMCYFVSPNNMIHQPLDLMQKRLLNYMNLNPTSRKTCSTIKQISILKDKFKEIIFRPADKNLGLCALHISQYDELVMDHLNNTNNYRLCSSNDLTKAQVYRSLLKNYHEFIGTVLWREHETPLINHRFSFTFPKFHILPKLHKTGTLKGRPIAGQVNWITTPISRIVDHRLQEQLLEFDNILKNSQQLVNEIEFGNNQNEFQDHDCYLITADIESLYPNMDISKLIKMIDKLDITCTSLVDYVCKNSYVEYNSKIYHQLNGIPMGTNAAVTLANIYVGTLIDKFIASRPQVIHYRRFIDDLFIIWKGDLRTWDGAQRGITNILGIPVNFDNPSKDHAIFLDLSIDWNPFTKMLDTSIYQKPLNQYSYITPTSCHTPHMFNGFIKGELQRYAKLSSTVFAYSRTKNLFYQRLLKRGYRRHYLNKIFKKHHWHSRLIEKDPGGPSILPFIIPYTLRKNSSSISKIVKESSEELSANFTYAKVLVAYKRRRNIGDLLCPSAISHDHKSLLRSKDFLFGPKKQQVTL
jgi:hypothetical protein